MPHHHSHDSYTGSGMFFIGFIILMFIIICIASHHLDAEATEISEVRTNAITELHEKGIATFEGDFYFKFVSFTDALHPFRPEFQDFEIIGTESTSESMIYYLIDSDGYTATLEFAHNGMPTWRPSYQPGTAEYNFNPKYEILYRHFIDGDFSSVRFIPVDSNSSD